MCKTNQGQLKITDHVQCWGIGSEIPKQPELWHWSPCPGTCRPPLPCRNSLPTLSSTTHFHSWLCTAYSRLFGTATHPDQDEPGKKMHEIRFVCSTDRLSIILNYLTLSPFTSRERSYGDLKISSEYKDRALTLPFPVVLEWLEFDAALDVCLGKFSVNMIRYRLVSCCRRVMSYWTW